MSSSQREKQKIQTRNNIVNTALYQFSKYGLMRTSTGDIAREAKVSHGTVFAHFPTRENLIDEVIEEFGQRITTRLHELVDNNCGMKEILQVHLKGIREYEAFYTRLVLEGSLLHESARSTWIMIQSAISSHIIEIAEREIEDGRITAMPVSMLFNTWVALIHYYLGNGDLFAPENSVLEKHGHQLIEHFMNLISIKRGEN